MKKELLAKTAAYASLTLLCIMLHKPSNKEIYKFVAFLCTFYKCIKSLKSCSYKGFLIFHSIPQLLCSLGKKKRMKHFTFAADKKIFICSSAKCEFDNYKHKTRGPKATSLT